MYKRQDEWPVYKATQHRQLTSRATLLRDRANNLFRAAETLAAVIPPDPRFESLRHLIDDYFTGIVVLFALEDSIDDTIVELAQEVGR